MILIYTNGAACGDGKMMTHITFMCSDVTVSVESKENAAVVGLYFF